jgi:hypothetical protein
MAKDIEEFGAELQGKRFSSRFLLLCPTFGPIIFLRFSLLKDEADTRMPSARPGFCRVSSLRLSLNTF